jgi:hypothetical protein
MSRLIFHIKRRRILLLFALLMALALTTSGSSASISQTCEPGPGDLCATSEHYMLTGALSGSTAGTTASTNQEILAARLATNGPLTYQDLVSVEEKAYALLNDNKAFREAISPHQAAEDFKTLVQQFDYGQDFDRVAFNGLTLQENLDRADSELRQARDLYAYLAVYADEDRFRDDPAYDGQCEVEDPFNDPPVIDRCDFATRMRESLREVAYLRMIFGQQFTADAMGFRFGENIVGGDAFVRDEVEQLEMAAEQYRLAKQAVTEGMDHYLGQGCYVYSFYTQAEWDLLSRAVEGLERAQHHIAVRKSYLAPTSGGLPAAQEEAETDFRRAAIDQYLDLALVANLSTSEPECQRGAQPDNSLVAKMQADLLSTRQSLMEMKAGRNVFGFDVSFTPARPFLTAPGSTDIGLLDQAKEVAEQAKTIQDDADNNERWFDREATLLRDAIMDVRRDYDLQLAANTGCSNDPPDDEKFFACIDAAAETLRTCSPLEENEAVFNACVSQVGSGGLLREAWEDVRSAFLEVRRAQQALENLSQREAIEIERNATVTDTILTNGREQAAMEFFATLMESTTTQISIFPVPGVSVSRNPFQPAIAALRTAQTLRQAVNDIKIEDANSDAVVRNLLLDVVEYQMELDIAAQKANAQVTVFENLASGTQDLAVEARRARAYLVQSPANDPSFRLVRDSTRLALADQLSLASRIAYMAAKRAEYEYAARLGVSSINISEIYQARTATDILNFLTKLENATSSLIVTDAETDRELFTMSVAQHVLGLTDEELGMSGEAARLERIRLFRQWVAANTHIGTDGKPVLVFSLATSPADDGIFSNVIAQAYDLFWLHKVSGIGQPKLASTGFGMNLVTSQATDLGYRRVAVTQSGVVHLKARSGCIFDYQLVHPAALLGLEWPDGQPTDIATSTFRAGVNEEDGTRTAAFLGRPVSSTDWSIVIYAGAPEIGLPDMDLQQLEDIELSFDSTYATRISSVPDPEDCIRIDY